MPEPLGYSLLDIHCILGITRICRLPFLVLFSLLSTSSISTKSLILSLELLSISLAIFPEIIQSLLLQERLLEPFYRFDSERDSFLKLSLPVLVDTPLLLPEFYK